MKHGISNISIPTPCEQEWHSMLPNAHGKYCTGCQKTVTDFTNLSNTEILKVLSAQGNVCGRFDKDQLITLNQNLAPQASFLVYWRKFSLAAAFIGLVPFVETYAKIKPKQYQNSVQQTKQVSPVDTLTELKKVSGVVIDSTDHTPIPGATVQIKDFGVVTYTDINGRFNINVPLLRQSILVINSIGHKSRTIAIDPNKSLNSKIELTTSDTMLSQTFAGGILVKRSLLSRFWYNIKRPFKKLFS